MADVGFSRENLDGISSALAVILHLGNIDFVESDDDSGHYFDLSISGPLGVLSTLLGVQAEDIGNSLVTQVMVMRGETLELFAVAVKIQ